MNKISRLSRFRSFTLAAPFAAGLALPARAATYTWDPNANRSDAAGSGFWNTTLPVWDNGTADVAYPNAYFDTAVFGGTDGTYTVTVANGIVSSMTNVNASGYTFAGASAATPGRLDVSYMGGNGSFNVATGKTLTIGANLTVNNGSGGYFNALNSSYAGTVVVNNGGVLNFYNTSIGGTLTVGANGSVNDPNGSSILTSGGTLNVNGAGASAAFRGLTVQSGAVVNINNGTFNTNGAFGLYFTGGTVNLNGGTFVASPTSSSSATGSTIRLNGGTIVSGGQYPGSIGNSGTTILVRGGGARFNVTSTFSISVGNGLLHDSTGPAVDGGLIVNGAGTVTLTAAGTYNGGTTVNGDTLVVSANGALGTGDASVIATSVSLKISTGVTNPFNNGLGRLTLAGGGTPGTADTGYLDLTSGASITVSSLTLGGTTYNTGVFTSASFPDYIAGAGTVTVVPEPGSPTLTFILAGGLGVAVRRTRRRARA